MNIYLTPEEIDNCMPPESDLLRYISEPDDATAKSLSPKEKRLVARVILYGNNVAKASADNAVRVIVEWIESNARHWRSLSFNDQCDGKEPTPMITLEMPQSQFDAALKKLTKTE